MGLPSRLFYGLLADEPAQMAVNLGTGPRRAHHHLPRRYDDGHCEQVRAFTRGSSARVQR